MGLSDVAVDAFAAEVRRLEGAGEPPLYPAYKLLLEAVYGAGYIVDTLLRQPGAGFPDFTVTRNGRLINWLEVKHPGVSVDPLPGPDQQRFDRYREALPHIVLTNGWTWRLFKAGLEIDRCDLPRTWLTGTTTLDAAQRNELERFGMRIAALTPSVASSDDEAVSLLASSAWLIERAVLDAEAPLPSSLTQAQQSFSDLLQTNPADPSALGFEEFADQLAQACVFGYVMARVEAGVDIDPYTAHGHLSNVQHPFLQATLHAMVAPDPQLQDALLGILRTACDAVNAAAPVLAGPAGDWKKVPYVYEPFFTRYKPKDRFKFGVFYTPQEITTFQVREIQDRLREDFGLIGLTDPNVRFLEPACGTGTYLLALAEEALAEAHAAGAPAGSVLKDLFEQRVVAFEVSPGPAAVAQARLASWLKGHGATLTRRLPVFTTNTLTPPAAGTAGSGAGPANIWMANVSLEQQATDRVKSERPILVVFGNPPWGDRPRDSFRIGTTAGQNIIAEWATGAEGAVINLYDLYVAFWRFACSLLLERPAVQPAEGIVSYITNRSWLRGKAYSGMRAWLRRHAAQATVTDLGGDSRAGARSDDEAVFAIRAGSAVATLAFRDGADGSVRLRRVRGSRIDKLHALASGALPPLEAVAGVGGDPFGPVDWGVLAHGLPIGKFFTKHYPGVKTHRDELVIDVDRDALLARLRAWNGKAQTARAEQFHNTDSRTLPDNVTIDDTLVVAHRYRPLDDRLLYNDRRFIDRPGGISAHYERVADAICLLTMDTRTTIGPAVIATSTLPGYDSFRGAYGSHAWPIVGTPEDAAQAGFQDPLMLPDALTADARAWLTVHHPGASAQDVACFLLALGNAPGYTQTFREALEVEIVRFPAVTDPDVFNEGVAIGERLLNAWMLQSPPAGTWTQVAAGIPLGEAQVLAGRIVFANGDVLDGLHPRIHEFEVSTYKVMERYLQARAHLTATPAVADGIRRVAAAIADILDEDAACDDLLARAIAEPYVVW